MSDEQEWSASHSGPPGSPGEQSLTENGIQVSEAWRAGTDRRQSGHRAAGSGWYMTAITGEPTAHRALRTTRVL